MNSKKANFIILLAVLLLGIALGVVGFMIHESYVQRQETDQSLCHECLSAGADRVVTRTT